MNWEIYEQACHMDGWNHPLFHSFQRLIDEEDLFLTLPIEIEEGVNECPKCKGRRTFSYQQQTRSADESTTTFLNCVDCNTSWLSN